MAVDPARPRPPCGASISDEATISEGNSEGKKPPGIMQFAGLGMMNALCWLLGMAGGWFVDRSLGTLPVFLLVGLVLGILLGVLASRSELKRFF